MATVDLRSFICGIVAGCIRAQLEHGGHYEITQPLVNPSTGQLDTLRFYCEDRRFLIRVSEEEG